MVKGHGEKGNRKRIRKKKQKKNCQQQKAQSAD